MGEDGGGRLLQVQQTRQWNPCRTQQNRQRPRQTQTRSLSESDMLLDLTEHGEACHVFLRHGGRRRQQMLMTVKYPGQG